MKKSQILLIVTSIFCSTAFANKMLSPNNFPSILRMSSSSACFIRVDSHIPISNISCTGTNNNCSCQTDPKHGTHMCAVMVGKPAVGEKSASCGITINYTNGEHDTISHDENGSDYDSPTSKLATEHLTSGFAKKVCPDGLNDCAYWKVKLKAQLR